MGEQAALYRHRKTVAKLAGITEVDHELDFYQIDYNGHPDWPRPCWCEWNTLQSRLLGQPSPPDIACACAGPISFTVPGYTGPWGEGDDNRMRRFCQAQAALNGEVT